LRGLLADAGPAAPFIALAAWAVLTPAMFPGTVLAAAGGLAFGSFGGSLLAFGGAVAGGCAAFLMARFAARAPAQRVVQRHARLTRVHALVERRGFASILAARLMPGIPVTALHYVAGVSPVRLRAFAAAIAIGAVLRTVPYAILGHGLSAGSLTTVLIAAGSIALSTVTAGVIVRRLLRADAAAA
jgi:uncharacterized membrane protein YdjX (TVP38/TMEM64 family)